MASLIPASVREYQAKSCALADYPSSVDSGIVGHPGTNTYHQSIDDIPNKNGYTNRYPDDKAPPGSWPRNVVVATDQSKNKQDMLLGWKRWKSVFDDKSDPRRVYVAEYIGTPDGKTARRLDFQNDTDQSNSDLTHTWHEHKARRRRYANDNRATVAMLSVDKGETKAQYLVSIGQKPQPQPEEDGMRNKWVAHCKWPKDPAKPTGAQEEFWVIVDDSQGMPFWVTVSEWDTHENAVKGIYPEYNITDPAAFKTLCGNQHPDDPFKEGAK